MRLRDSILRDAETVRTLDKKDRAGFIWDYYKIPILAVASIALLALLTFALRLGSGNAAMYAVFVNADDSGDAAVLTGLLERSGMDLEGRTVSVAAGYTLRYDDPANTYADTIQVLAALFGIGDLDVFAADDAVFRAYAEKGAFIDLGLFIERDVLERHQLYTYTDESGRQVVAGIWLHEGSPLHTAGYYSSDVLIGVAANAQNLDPAIEFMKQLTQEV